MSDYLAERDSWGAHELAVLTDQARGRCVRIARRGATLVKFEVPTRDGTRDLADGYRDAGELDTRPSSRFAIMVPFANRIADARYSFDGEVHDLQPGVEGAQRAARHGFVRGVDFDITELSADAQAARVTFATQAIRPGVHPGYPFAIDLAVTYTLDAVGLTLEARMRNVGDRAAPCFFGWHPYFRLGDSPIDSWALQIPADSMVRTDGDFIPLPGDAARVAMASEPEFDFRQAQPIGTRELNHAFADLRRDGDGRARTRLSDPASGVAIALWQTSGVMLAFTADTVTRDVRRSVALEPMESWADAFNRPDCAATIRLEPGTERHLHLRRGDRIDMSNNINPAALPSFDQVQQAAARIAPYAVLTPVLRSPTLNALSGADLYFKCENLQRGGAFKFRGACNAVWSLDDEQAARGVVTHSSGNHGNALALAAATRGIAAHVIVPDGAVRTKVEAIERAGAILHRCEATQAAREAKAEEVRLATGAELVHPYADTRVMAGQGTAAWKCCSKAVDWMR